jgi:hypothetical protein
VPDFIRLIVLLIEAVLLMVRYRYDPERLKRELQARIDDETQRRRQAFRDAVAKGDEDTVSRMLADARDRLRDGGVRPDAEGDVPPAKREGDPPEAR